MQIEKLHELGHREMVSCGVKMDAVAIELDAGVIRLLELRIEVEARDRVLLHSAPQALSVVSRM